MPGAKGQPIVASSDAPNLAAMLNAVSDFAAAVGTRRVGTVVERNAFTAAGHATDGDEWYVPSTDVSYIRSGGVWLVKGERRAVAIQTDRSSFPTGFIDSFNLSIVSGETTDPGLIATPAAIANKVTIAAAGYYSVTWFANFGVSVTASSPIAINRGATTLIHQANCTSGQGAVTLGAPDVYFAAGDELVFYANKVAGSTATFAGKLVIAKAR